MEWEVSASGISFAREEIVFASEPDESRSSFFLYGQKKTPRGAASADGLGRREGILATRLVGTLPMPPSGPSVAVGVRRRHAPERTALGTRSAQN